MLVFDWSAELGGAVTASERGPRPLEGPCDGSRPIAACSCHGAHALPHLLVCGQLDMLPGYYWTSSRCRVRALTPHYGTSIQGKALGWCAPWTCHMSKSVAMAEVRRRWCARLYHFRGDSDQVMLSFLGCRCAGTEAAKAATLATRKALISKALSS